MKMKQNQKPLLTHIMNMQTFRFGFYLTIRYGIFIAVNLALKFPFLDFFRVNWTLWFRIEHNVIQRYDFDSFVIRSKQIVLPSDLFGYSYALHMESSFE